MKGLQLIASSYGLQHQMLATKGLQLIKIYKKLWTVASKSKQRKGLQQIKVSIKGGQRKGYSRLKLASNYELQQHKAYIKE